MLVRLERVHTLTGNNGIQGRQHGACWDRWMPVGRVGKEGVEGGHVLFRVSCDTPVKVPVYLRHERKWAN